MVLWTKAEEDKMPRKGHSEEQIICALRQAKAGKKVGDICREMGVSQQAFYSWKRRMPDGVSELRELRQLREENRELKTLVADLTSGQAHAAGSAVKKSLKPAARRQWCEVSVKAYRSVNGELAGWWDHALDLTVIKAGRIRKRNCESGLLCWPANRPRYGYRRLTVLLTARRLAGESRRGCIGFIAKTA